MSVVTVWEEGGDWEGLVQQEMCAAGNVCSRVHDVIHAASSEV
jgi:hypothetical protein